jgi:hypothetical protein
VTRPARCGVVGVAIDQDLGFAVGIVAGDDAANIE